MRSIFGQGFGGLSDTLFRGQPGSVFRSVGVDHRSEPGKLKVHQKLAKHSPTSGGHQVTELCKTSLQLSDGSRLHFSSESGKIWREVSGTYTLVFTTDFTNADPLNLTALFNTRYASADGEAILTDDGTLTNNVLKISQPITPVVNTDIRRVDYFLREIGGLDGGYSLKLTIYRNDDENNTPRDNQEVATKTIAIGTGDIGTSLGRFTINLDEIITLTAGIRYWFTLEVVSYGDIDAGEGVGVSMTEEEAELDTEAKFYNTVWSKTWEAGGPYRIRMQAWEVDSSEEVYTFTSDNFFPFDTGQNVFLRKMGDGFAQSITISNDIDVEYLEMFFSQTGISSDIDFRVTVQSDDGNAPSGVILGEVLKTVAVADLGTVRFDFGTAVSLEQGVNYWVVTEVVNGEVTGESNGSWLRIGTSGESLYSGGQALMLHRYIISSTHQMNLTRSSSQYASIADGSQTGLNITGDMTLESYVDPSTIAVGETHTLMAKHNPTGNQMGYRFYIRRNSGGSAADNELYLGLAISSDGSSETTKEVLLDNVYATYLLGGDNVWHFGVAYDASAGEATFYVNGRQRGVVQTSLPTSIFNNTASFRLGGADNGNYLNGAIIDARAWNTTRTPAQMWENYGVTLIGNESGLVSWWRLNNSLVDETSNNNDLTASGATFSERLLDIWDSIAANGESLSGFDIKVNLVGGPPTGSPAVTPGETKCLDAKEHNKYVYWATENRLSRIKVEYVGQSWSDRAQAGYASFQNGSKDHHPMVRLNNQLYIGDVFVIAQVDEDDVFIQETFFNIPENETIRALTTFDIDILVGTKGIGFGRILRWDGLSESWSAEDIVQEKEGVTAFINDDNLVYAVVGTDGEIFFYNGAKLEDFLNIPGITGTDYIKVNPNATAYFRGVPIFGVSNGANNPVLQGVYGFGSYSSRYPKGLSLDYPISAFSGLEIGALLVDGDDLYVAYKSGSDVGVAKLNWSAKYEDAYIETRALSGYSTRHQLKTIIEAMVTYFSLPANTSLTLGWKKGYEANYTDYEMVTDTERLLVRPKVVTVGKVANPQLRLKFGVNTNTAPVAEDILYDTDGDRSPK